jgi:hypothetical protein
MFAATLAASPLARALVRCLAIVSRRRLPTRIERAAACTAALLVLAPSCEPELVVGRYGTEGDGGEAIGGEAPGGGGVAAVSGAGAAVVGGAGAPVVGGEGGSAACESPQRIAGLGGEGNDGVGPPSNPLIVPWTTSFENGFCDYAEADGYCYVEAFAGFEVVTSPVRSGSFAAAYTLNTDAGLAGHQSRCVRGGQLPEAAYYSAYFFIPEAPSATANWNLMHFRGIDGDSSHGLWDVSIARTPAGSLRVYIFDHLRALVRDTTSVPALPVGEWFQLEVYWRRAADATGALTLYQDGEVAFDLTELITDDSSLGEWYVGNLAATLTPAISTIYVDDVAIREAP